MTNKKNSKDYNIIITVLVHNLVHHSLHPSLLPLPPTLVNHHAPEWRYFSSSMHLSSSCQSVRERSSALAGYAVSVGVYVCKADHRPEDDSCPCILRGCGFTRGILEG